MNCQLKDMKKHKEFYEKELFSNVITFREKCSIDTEQPDIRSDEVNRREHKLPYPIR